MLFALDPPCQTKDEHRFIMNNSQEIEKKMVARKALAYTAYKFETLPEDLKNCSKCVFVSTCVCVYGPHGIRFREEKL